MNFGSSNNRRLYHQGRLNNSRPSRRANESNREDDSQTSEDSHFSDDDVDKLQPPIGINQDFDFSKMPMVTFTSPDHGKKKSWMTDGSSKEGFLYAIKQFETMAAALHYTAKERMLNIKDILSLHLHQFYQVGLQVCDIDINSLTLSEDKYEQFKSFLIRQLFSIADRSTMLSFLRSNHSLRRLPPGKATRAYWLRLQVLRTYTDMMPGDQPLPTDDEMQEAYFFGQPQSWQQEYNKQYDLPTSISMDELLAFMERQERLHTLHTSKRTSRTAKHKNKNDNKAKNQRPRHLSFPHCPLHPTANHTWYYCIGNPEGPNYDHAWAERRSQQHQHNQNTPRLATGSRNHNGPRVNTSAPTNTPNVNSRSHTFVNVDDRMQRDLPDEASTNIHGMHVDQYAFI
jgi:hypothetical protein